MKLWGHTRHHRSGGPPGALSASSGCACIGRSHLSPITGRGVKLAAGMDGPGCARRAPQSARKPGFFAPGDHGFFLADPATQLRELWTHTVTHGVGLWGDIAQFVGTYGMAHNPLLCSGLVFAGVNTVLEGTGPFRRRPRMVS